MDVDMVPTIMAARIGINGERGEVIVWQKVKKHAVPDQPASPPPAVNHKISIAEICMFFASVAFLWQNMAAFALVVDGVRRWFHIVA